MEWTEEELEAMQMEVHMELEEERRKDKEKANNKELMENYYYE